MGSCLLENWKPGPQGQIRDHWLCLEKWKVFKSEARNPKQYRTRGASACAARDGNSNDPNKRHTRHCDIEVVFVIRAFDIWICFEFRYSDFEFCRSHLPKSCPLDPDYLLCHLKPGPPGRDLGCIESYAWSVKIFSGLTSRNRYGLFLLFFKCFALFWQSWCDRKDSV